mgnify:CR=1 FL=1
MERLTRRLADGRACFKPHLYGHTNKEVCDRLASYEDTGLEPEEITAIIGLASENCAKTADKIDQLLSDDKELGEYRVLGPIDRLRELAQADREGRCVVLPCKRDDVLWTFHTYPSKRVYSFHVTDLSTLNGRTMLNTDIMGVVDSRDVGKTVFLTRKEAQAALRREQE